MIIIIGDFIIFDAGELEGMLFSTVKQNSPFTLVQFTYSSLLETRYRCESSDRSSPRTYGMYVSSVILKLHRDNTNVSYGTVCVPWSTSGEQLVYALCSFGERSLLVLLCPLQPSSKQTNKHDEGCLLARLQRPSSVCSGRSPSFPSNSPDYDCGY